MNKPEGRGPLGRSGHRLQDNIKKIRWVMDWINLTQEGQVVGCCEHDNGPSDSIHGMEFLE